jgi:hypothetical protein
MRRSLRGRSGNFQSTEARHEDRHLAVRRAQGNGGSQKKLAAVCRGMTRRAIPAWRKGYCRLGQDKYNAVLRTQKGRTFRKTSGETRRHHQNKEPRLKTAITPREQCKTL